MRTSRAALVTGTTLLAFSLVASMLVQISGRAVLEGTLFTIGPTAVIGMGTLIAYRRPELTYGWVLLAVIGFSALTAFASAYTEWARATDSPGVAAVAVLGDTGFAGVASSAPLLVHLFPDGRLPSRRWRWLRWVFVSTVAAFSVALVFGDETGYSTVNPIRPPVLLPGWELAGPVWAVGLAIMFLSAPVGLVVRWKRSHGIERAQLKWMISSIAVLTVSGVVAFITGSEVFFSLWACAAMVILPVAVGVAVLRYRLYDIDRLVSRAVSYAVMSAVIALPYLAIVTGITHVASSDLAVALATLAAAAVFQPLRRRVQDRVDRRFNRARYDAVRTVEAFRSRLRDEVALETLERDLLAVVNGAVQPSRASMWLRPA